MPRVSAEQPIRPEFCSGWDVKKGPESKRREVSVRTTIKFKTSAKDGESAAADQWVAQRTTASEDDAVEPVKRITIDVPQSLHRRIKMGCGGCSEWNIRRENGR